MSIIIKGRFVSTLDYVISSAARNLYNHKVIAAHLGRTIPGYMPRAHGRSTPWNQQTVNIEVILEEMK